MILVPVLLLTLLLEEIIYRLSRVRSIPSVELSGNPVEERNESERGDDGKLKSWIRMVQLFLFGALIATTAAKSGVRLMYTPAGQVSSLLLLTQVARIFYRKVVNQWSVLGATVILQCLLLALMPLLGLNDGNGAATCDFQGKWFVTLLSFSTLFMLSITIPFCCTYYGRLLAKEDSDTYYSMPPLAYSEYWVRRLTRATAVMALTTFLALAFLTLFHGLPPSPATAVHLATTVLLFSSLFLFGKRETLHHPWAITMVSAAWLLNIGAVLAAGFAPCHGWIV